MKILILGGDGMLGHQLLLSLKNKYQVCVTLHQNSNSYKKYNLFNSQNSYFNLDVCNKKKLRAVIADFKPNVIINAIGIVKQRETAKDTIPCIEVNTLFPHRLSQICAANDIRLIHISTDCVFSGRKGKYVEDDLSDAEDLYGKSKFLGEVNNPNCLTIRSSLIGLELSRKTGLIEWFLAQKGLIKGFRGAIFSGLTTLEMTRVIELLLIKYPNLSGIWHISSEPINKYDLLSQFSHMLERKDIEIMPENDFRCDRSLISQAFKKITTYQAPTWLSMLSELAEQVRVRNRI